MYNHLSLRGYIWYALIVFFIEKKCKYILLINELNRFGIQHPNHLIDLLPSISVDKIVF